MRFLLAVIFLFVCVNAYADTITITVTKEEVKAVEAIVVDAQEWLQKAWDGKATKCIERAVKEISDKQPAKMTKEEKAKLIKDTEIKTRKEKDSE